MATKKYAPVHCRACGKAINRNLEVESIDWVMPSKNFFYHVKCYNDWAKKNDEVHAVASKEEWYQALLYYLNHIIKAPIDYKKLKSQWNKYTSQKTKTPKGVYFAVKYFYEVQHGDKEKSQGGIGIISYIYEDSCRYWHEKEEKDEGIVARIEQQAAAFVEQQKEQTIIKRQKKDRQRAADIKFFDALNELGEDDEIE